MKNFLFLLTLVLLFTSVNVHSQNNKSYLAFSAAAFDILQKDKSSLEGRIEYRYYNNWFVKPFAGVMYNVHDAFHFFVGFLKDIPITANINLTPSFAPGLYSDGHSKKLGYIIQFRSQIELTFTNTDGSKFGISFNHISNASLSDSNPGVESLALTYIIPL